MLLFYKLLKLLKKMFIHTRIYE